jgi:cell division protein FtsB
MGALSATGKEGALRTRYVEQLEATEDQLRSLDRREADLKAEIQRLNQEVAERLEVLG